MRILVCLSSVPDTTTKIRFKDQNTAFDPTGVQWIINPWDELALTRALELKENPAAGVEKITVATVGTADTEPVIRKALAIGADDAFRVDTLPRDAYYVAMQLASVLKKEPSDIILAGIESSDHNGSSVGGMLSEILGIPSVSAVSGLTIDNGNVILNREIDGGREIIGIKSPFVAIVQKGIAKEPRIAAMRGIMLARTKPLKVFPPVEAEPLTETLEYQLPLAKKACTMVDPASIGELVKLLQNEAKVL
ncbi:MAG: electron transfer flavoprotein subunit beta/FixA family protein [Bacteroidales bacterium]|nr:electron transfer flavoprotein subunit beta/FixA family protein [Bacteroidales bacterium]